MSVITGNLKSLEGLSVVVDLGKNMSCTFRASYPSGNSDVKARTYRGRLPNRKNILEANRSISIMGDMTVEVFPLCPGMIENVTFSRAYETSFRMSS